MRILFAATAGDGHFGPLVPFAEACRQAGFDVWVTLTPPSFDDPTTHPTTRGGSVGGPQDLADLALTVSRVLVDGVARTRGQAVAAEIQSLPPVSDAAAVIAALT
jgi:hypothetical protein